MRGLADKDRMELTPNIDMLNLTGVALALALGLLVGIERGWAQREQRPGSRFAGIRTFGLLGLSGGVAGLLAQSSALVSGVLVAATAGLVVIGYLRSSSSGGSRSATASVVALLTLACGYLAASGTGQLATAIIVATVLLLAMRKRLHRLVGHLSEDEVTAIARFALIAVVVLPLLPDCSFGPYDAWNFRSLWLVVVLVSGFSFAGYIAARMLGSSRGTIATAAAGSMVSSTAVTASLAQRINDEPAARRMLNAAIAAASAMMFVRVIVLVAWLAPFALMKFALLMAPGLAVSLLAAVLLLWRADRSGPSESAAITVKNPFAIMPALLLMALVMAMTLAARWVLERYGSAGLAPMLALSGIADVDSAIITMGNLPRGTLDARTAALVLVPPVVLNTLFKAGIAISIAGWRPARLGAAVLSASALVTLVAAGVAW